MTTRAGAWVIYRAGSNVGVRPFATVAEAHDWARRNRGSYPALHIATTKAEYNRFYLAEHRKADRVMRGELKR